MKIPPSSDFDGADAELLQLEAYAENRHWGAEARTPAVAVFFHAKRLKIDKVKAVDWLHEWLGSRVHLNAGRNTLMAWANFAYKHYNPDANRE